MRNFLLLLFLLLLLLNSCTKETEYSSLNVYIEEPALFYILSIYQQKHDSTPLSIHLRHGLNMFFQLIGRGRLINAQENDYQDHASRLNLGGGIFLSSELMQLAQPELYMEQLSELPKPMVELGIEKSLHLRPLLLYPAMFELTNQASQTTQAKPSHLQNDPLQQNFIQSGISRLLAPKWLKEQLLQTEPEQNYVHLQTPRQILLDYLHGSSMRLYLSPQKIRGLNSISSDLQQFMRDYQALLANQQTEGQNEQNENSSLRETRKQGKIDFIRLQQKLYQNTPKEYILSYQNAETKIAPSAYPYLYFKGSLQKNVLQLQLERVLWAGISKNLSATHKKQAIKLLSWLQSLEGQQTLQQQIALLDSKRTLGIFRSLSIYPQVNTLFWDNLQLNWPERFDICWQLPGNIIQWTPTLFEKLSLEQEYLLRKQSALTVLHSFILPYLFFPEDKKTNIIRLNWSQWLPD